MKTILFSAAFALCAISASAQTEPATEANPVSTMAKETTLQGKEKGQAVSELAKSKAKNEVREDDQDGNGKLSREERQARKAAKKAAKESRKADLEDDGIINGSSVNNEHGTSVSDVAKETTLEGKEKGMAVKDAARTKARNGAKAQRPEMKRPDHTSKGSRPAKPSGAGRPAGAGRPGNK